MKKNKYLLTILCFMVFGINAFAQPTFIPKERTRVKSHYYSLIPTMKQLQAARNRYIQLDSIKGGLTQVLKDELKKAKDKLFAMEQAFNAPTRYNLLLSNYQNKMHDADSIYESTLNKIANNSPETYSQEKQKATEVLDASQKEANKIYESAIGEFVDFRLNRHLFMPLSHFKFDRGNPKTTSRLVEYFFEDKVTKYFTNIGENNTININPDGALSVYSEIATSYLLFGKVYIATQVSKSNASDAATKASEETVQNQLSGGGNMILGYQIPIVRGSIGDGLLTYGSVFTLFKTGLNVPAVNTSVADPSFSFEHGLNAYFTLGNGNISFYGNSNLSFMWGDKKYRNVLNTTFGDKSFLLTQFNLGINIANAYRIGVNIIPNFNDATSKFPTMTINTAFIPL